MKTVKELKDRMDYLNSEIDRGVHNTDETLILMSEIEELDLELHELQTRQGEREALINLFRSAKGCSDLYQLITMIVGVALLILVVQWAGNHLGNAVEKQIDAHITQLKEVANE